MRWELNDLARRLDEQPAAVELREGLVPAPASSGSVSHPDGRRMLEAIDDLPEDEREVFGLVRIQGLTQAEAAEVLGVSAKTVQRRLNRGLVAAGGAAGRPPAELTSRPGGEDRRICRSGTNAVGWLRRSARAATARRDPRLGRSPEEVCRDCPELLPQVRERLKRSAPGRGPGRRVVP